MVQNKTVEEFESWFKVAVAQLFRCGAIVNAQDLEQRKPILQLVWEESRAAVAIDLPPTLDTDKLYFPAYDADAVHEAIRAAGLKVAP